MALPFFYIPDYDSAQSLITLDEDNSRHVVSVLRMPVGKYLHLTDGKGNLLKAEIADDHKKRCVVKVLSSQFRHQTTSSITIAISPVKNNSRFEWFLEKVTEIGINKIIPIICERTEKQHFRADRMKNILVSAMLQSQQTWLPELTEPVKLMQLPYENYQQKFIAHCDDTHKQSLASQLKESSPKSIILVGPEGDFSTEEIEWAIKQEFIPVTLGETRLRTETAGMVAATLLRISH